jgi:hypothetical protein
MVSVEIMGEACSLLAGSTSLHVIENVRAFAWIALDDGALTLKSVPRSSTRPEASIARRSSMVRRES